MKQSLVPLLLAAAALAGCAQLGQPHADAGATAAEQTSPYPRSSSNLGLF
jgi:hypothetical protein